MKRFLAAYKDFTSTEQSIKVFKGIGISLYALIAVLFVAMTVLSSCTDAGTSTSAGTPTDITISAAASLKNALQKLAGDFEKKENAKLVFNFASSGDLQTQIEQGAPADVFISAGKKQMDALDKKQLIDKDTRLNLLGNDLVIVVPKTSAISINKVEDIASVGGVNKIAIGTPETVPAGKYAQEALETAKIWEAIQPKLVMAKDVKQVLSYVETGNTDIGFVYQSDAKISKEAKVAMVVPDSYHKPIVYPAAVIKGTKQSVLAKKFIDYLTSEGSSKVFKEFGFKPASK